MTDEETDKNQLKIDSRLLPVMIMLAANTIGGLIWAGKLQSEVSQIKEQLTKREQKEQSESSSDRLLFERVVRLEEKISQLLSMVSGRRAASGGTREFLLTDPP